MHVISEEFPKPTRTDGSSSQAWLSDERGRQRTLQSAVDDIAPAAYTRQMCRGATTSAPERLIGAFDPSYCLASLAPCSRFSHSTHDPCFGRLRSREPID